MKIFYAIPYDVIVCTDFDIDINRDFGCGYIDYASEKYKDGKCPQCGEAALIVRTEYHVMTDQGMM